MAFSKVKLEIIDKWLHSKKHGRSVIDILIKLKPDEPFLFSASDFKNIEASDTDIYCIIEALNEYFNGQDFPFKASYDREFVARTLIHKCEEYRDGQGCGDYPEIKKEFFLEMFSVKGKSIPKDLKNWLYNLPKEGLNCMEVTHKETDFIQCEVVCDGSEENDEPETPATEEAHIKKTRLLYCYFHKKFLNTENELKKHCECQKPGISKTKREIKSDNKFSIDQDRATIEKQNKKIQDEIKAIRELPW